MPVTDEYLPEPQYSGDQDLETFDMDDVLDQIQGFLARATVPTAPRDLGGALDWWDGQIHHPDRDYDQLCQMYSRLGPGCPGGFGSAWLQWVGMPDEWKLKGVPPDEVPAGWILFTKGTSIFGHAFPKTFTRSDDTNAASTNARRHNAPDRVKASDLIRAWGHTYLGAGRLMNGYLIDVHDPKPPRDERYEAFASVRARLANAIEDLRDDRDLALRQGFTGDAERLQNQIDHARAFRRRLRELDERLRHR